MTIGHGLCTVSGSLALGKDYVEGMKAMATVTISIGRNVGSEPMSDEAWHNFGAAIDALLARYGATVFVGAADSRGVWEGIAEDSRTWVASVDDSALADIRYILRDIAGDYRQDAIALTVGNTELVGA